MSTPVEIPSDVQTVLWDLDGTLLDSLGIYHDCLNEVLENRGRPRVSEEILRNNHHGFIEESIPAALSEAGQSFTKSELVGIFQDFYTLDNVYIEHVDDHLFADALQLAVKAHQAGKRQIVVTSRPHGTDRGNGSPRNLVANSRLRPLISDVLCGDDSVYRKPHREFLEARFGPDLTPLGNTLVIGDQFVDGAFARNIGGTAILVARGAPIAHLDRLDNHGEYVQIVPSLYNVRL